MNSKQKRKSKSEVLFIISGLLIPVLTFAIFYIVPNFSAFFMGFMDRNGNLSLDNFRRVFETFARPDGDLTIALKNTLLTFSIIVVSFPFKVLVSYFIYKKVPFAGFYRIVFFLPTIVFSVAISLVFNQLIGTNGFIAKAVGELAGLDYAPELLADSRYANWVILLQMVWLGFPGDLIIWGGTFARIPADILESGQIDGVNWWTEFTKIIVPMVWPTVGLQMVLMACGLFSASGNVFLLTKGEFGTITFTAWMYLQMYNHSGPTYTSNVFNYLSAVGLLITAVAILLSIAIRKFADKRFEEVEF